MEEDIWNCAVIHLKNVLNGLHGGVVVSTVASQQEGSKFDIDIEFISSCAKMCL